MTPKTMKSSGQPADRAQIERCFPPLTKGTLYSGASSIETTVDLRSVGLVLDSARLRSKGNHPITRSHEPSRCLPIRSLRPALSLDRGTRRIPKVHYPGQSAHNSVADTSGIDSRFLPRYFPRRMSRNSGGFSSHDIHVAASSSENVVMGGFARLQGLILPGFLSVASAASASSTSVRHSRSSKPEHRVGAWLHY
jgi:hypothetical protein